MKVLNIGSCNIDYVYQVDHFVQPGETMDCLSMQAGCGGKGLNQSIAIAQAGAEVFHAGFIGPEGEFLRKKLEDKGVDTSLLRTCKGANGHAIIQVQPDGQNCIFLYGGSNQSSGPDEIDAVLSHFTAGDYLLLQKARYNNCLLYEFDIPEELLECRVPKLLLQPVIENSITHGYRAGQTLHIRVQAEHRDDTLRFIVTDDGAGIPAGRLAELRESFEHDLTNEYAAHVGLYNIQKVIRLTYGAPYGVQIESTEGQGTAVTLTIPYEVEENEGC